MKWVFRITAGLLIVFNVVVLMVFNTEAATIVSKATGGNWNNAGTWVSGAVPGVNDNVFIDGPVSVTANTTCNTLQVNSGKKLTINSGITLSVTLGTVQNWSYNYVANNLGTITLAPGGSNSLNLSLGVNQSWPVLSNSGSFAGNTGSLSTSQTNNTVAIANTGQFEAPLDVTITNTMGGAASVTGTIDFTNLTINKATQMQLSSSVTIYGTLKLINGAYFHKNASAHPTYDPDAILEIAESFSTNGNQYLWPAGSGSSVPSNIYISSGTVTLEEIELYIKKNLLIASGATLNAGKVCMYLTSSFENIMNFGTARLGGMSVLNGSTWNINANYTISTLKIESGGTVNANSYNLTIDNSLKNNCNISTGDIMEKVVGGTFNAGTSTVTFIPAYWSDIEANNVVGGIVFNNVEVSGTKTLNVPNNSSMTVNGNLTLSSGATINTPQNINFGNDATINNYGTTQNGSFPSTVGTAASGTSGGGLIDASKWVVVSPNTFTVTSNITFTGTPKVVVIQQGATLIAGQYTITCDSVYIKGAFSTSNVNGLTGTFGSAVIVVGPASNITYNRTVGVQNVSARTDYVNLTLSGGATKNFASGTYEISGDYNVTGAYPSYNTNAVMRFDGTTQAVSCPVFNSVEFTNSGTKTLSINTSVYNTLTLAGSATLATNNNLVLVSNASGTARIATIPGSANITGYVTVQRYIPSIARRSRLISPNVSGFTYTDLKDDIFFTGDGGATNGFDYSKVNQITGYTYNESGSSRGWNAVNNINNSLAPGKGALIFVRGDRTLPTPQWYTAPYIPQNAVTIDFYGSINKGNISPDITYTNTGSAGDDGWNLVGNPYPSQIDWTLVTKNNLYPFYYTLDANTGSYVAHDETSPYIASGQAFFVQAAAASPSLTFTESCKTGSSAVNYFKTSSAPFTVKMIKDSINSDLAVLAFRSNASKGYDPMEDAVKLTNSVINLGFQEGSDLLQYSRVPVVQTADTFSIYAMAASGTYTLDFENVSIIPANLKVYLKDLFTGSFTDLRTTTTYAFTISSNAGSKGNRFQLIIGDPSALPVKWLGVSAFADEHDAVIKWSTASEKNNAGFTIERSSGKNNWQTVGFVEPGSNISTVTNYSFTDAGAFDAGNVLYYRVKQTDKNGTASYSATVSVKQEILNTVSISVYPNPATNLVNLDYGSTIEEGTAEVFDMFGKRVFSQEIKAATQSTFDISTLPVGVYTIKISGNEQELSTLKFVKE
jgi:hypothetical protein